MVAFFRSTGQAGHGQSPARRFSPSPCGSWPLSATRGRSYRSRPSAASSSASRILSMKPRTRFRTPASKGSNQSSPRKSVPSAASRGTCGIRFHGVISIGAPTPIWFEQTNWRLRHPQIPTTPATAPGSAMLSNAVAGAIANQLGQTPVVALAAAGLAAFVLVWLRMPN